MLRKLLTFIAMVLSVAVSAKDYQFKEGVNTVDAFLEANATYTPDRDGKILIEAQQVWSVEYDGKAYDYRYVNGSNYSYVYELNDVKAGNSVSLYLAFPMMTTNVKITVYGDGPVPVKVLNLSPSTGKTFDWNNTGLVSINFNKVVYFSSIKFVAGDYTSDVDDVHAGSSLGFNITNALNGALRDGKLSKGEKFQVKITGLCDASDRTNLYNGNGELVLEYIAPYLQYNFVSAKVGEEQLTYMQANAYKFLSYYSPDQEDGLFVFEFEGEIGKVGGVWMTMGNLDLDSQGKYYRGSLPYTISGNKLLVDARGVLRTIAVLFPAIVEGDEEGGETNEMLGTFDKEHVTITLSNVIDVNGNAFLCQAQGSVGSYSFVMNYEEIIDEAYIDGDNKQEGDPVYAGEEVKLWLSNEGIKFGGLQVTYFVEAKADDENDMTVLEPRTALVTEYSTESDGLGGMIITFNMPKMEGVATGNTVRVALYDAKSADGMPHYLYIEFVSAEEANHITGIGAKTVVQDNSYRLDGVRANGQKKAGIYLQNGKKVVLK